MKKTLFLFLISLLITRIAAAQSANDLFEKIDPYQKPAAVSPQQPQPYGYPPQQAAPNYPGYQQQAPLQVYQPPHYQLPPQQPQQPVAPTYQGYPPQAPQQVYQPPHYQPPAPVNPDAVKVFGNGFENLYQGQTQQQPAEYEEPAWQNPGAIDPGKEEKNYETRLKEGLEKPLPKRNITIGDDRIDELRNRVNALAVPKAKK